MAKGRPDFSPTAVDVSLVADWAAKEGLDKNFTDFDVNIAVGSEYKLIYAVPVGKTLYINQIGFAIFTRVAASAELNQIGYFYIYDATDDVYLFYMGGNGGGAITFPKPLSIKTGHTIWIALQNRSNHECDLFVSAGGYEV